MNNNQPPYGQPQNQYGYGQPQNQYGYGQPQNQYGQPQAPYGQPQNGYNQYPGGQKPPMSFQEAVTTCFNKYCCFTGRATRAEYWWWALFSFICSLVGLAIDSLLGTSIIQSLITLALLLPGLGVAWRRLHDIGKGGGWYFIGLIPLVGWILIIVWFCTPSEPYDNRFGPYPG